jgi:ribonuclease PH
MTRPDDRHPEQLRPITFETEFSRWAEGSVLARFGHTHVLCNVTIENSLPPWLRYAEDRHGWLTAEYAMLPRSTHQRTRREQRWPRGRTQEISRLIGRSLRQSLHLKLLGDRTLIVDCDVLQADGGTRTAAVCGGWVAVQLALQPLIFAGELPQNVLARQIAAVSAGIVDGAARLDLAYEEDAAAAVDINVVMTGEGELVEIQGTAEGAPFSRDQLASMLDLSAAGIQHIAVLQRAALVR